MIMVLYLLIYSIAEWKLRTRLKEENGTVPYQIKKSAKTPAMRWIFFIFQGIIELITEKKRELSLKF
ncbi:hypothetical protein MSSIT_0895 [Methanosarcina siciliae T4/M]|uniref:Mobile element protein n=2 Tax=Methanosarcina siciliae TaxID=38027 RepID=A0A0E3PBD5_9EURY|nr:hypothetical protein MSSIT_0895 [Methanosarcina siciliae T4/M]AKB31552.1 hypothetical protein MSSIH_0862 [Methanosarcina siciliae HI350]